MHIWWHRDRNVECTAWYIISIYGGDFVSTHFYTCHSLVLYNWKKSIPFTYKPFFVNKLRLKMTEMFTLASKKGAKWRIIMRRNLEHWYVYWRNLLSAVMTKRWPKTKFLGWHRGILLLIASHTDAHSALGKREVEFLGENNISRFKRSLEI